MVSKQEMTCERSHPGEFALRPTMAGDICILLETNLPEETASLKERQADLQSLYGGDPVPLIHLTCQRFYGENMNSAKGELAALVEEIEGLCPHFTPIPITAVALVPLYVPFDRQNVLKWCIHVSQDLRAFCDELRGALERARISSLYQPWFVPTLVTALKGLPSLDQRTDLGNNAAEFPQHLLTGRRLHLSRINARNDYDILATFNW